MPDFQLSKPVAFIIFNRAEYTERVFEEIKRARPPKLLVIADGPRPDKPDDIAKCRATRELIERVNWPCEVLKNYSDVNLGCKQRVSSGLDWVFDQVEDAIILEDDCLPHPTFFRYCELLLDRYRDDERIMMISGDNFQCGRKREDYSYYYSHFTHIWGWASWRRSWKWYDVAMSLWPEVRDGGWLRGLLGDRKAVAYWTKIYNDVHAGTIDTWDYQFVFASWINNALTILPTVNLVTNIGYGAQSTHTHQSDSRYSNVLVQEMRFPLSHPPLVIRNVTADDYEQDYWLSHLSLRARAIRALMKTMRALRHRIHSHYHERTR